MAFTCSVERLGASNTQMGKKLAPHGDTRSGIAENSTGFSPKGMLLQAQGLTSFERVYLGYLEKTFPLRRSFCGRARVAHKTYRTAASM